MHDDMQGPQNPLRFIRVHQAWSRLTTKVTRACCPSEPLFRRNTLFALLPILATFPVTLLFVILEGNLMDDASAGYANVFAIACWYEDSENRGPESVSALSL
jgi:hypothetical protein